MISSTTRIRAFERTVNTEVRDGNAKAMDSVHTSAAAGLSDPQCNWGARQAAAR